jgi:SAM-dependent methyltransferase
VSKAPSAQEKYPTFLDDQRQFFDELITEEWDTYQSADWDRRRRFEIDCLFERVQPSRILDVGCGCGFHDLVMADKSGVEQVIGIDYSQKSIETANRVYPHLRVNRFVSDINEMGRFGGFDLVVSFQVIEHLSDPTGFLKSCASHATPGGAVAMVTPNRLRLSNRIRVLGGGRPKLGDPQHFREYIAEELAALGREAGLSYAGHFGYGLTLKVPRVGLGLLPAWANIRLGYLLSALSDCICVVFRSGDSVK